MRSLAVFCLDPCEWGWAMVNGVYEPVALSIECAPDQLLKFVRWKCKVGAHQIYAPVENMDFVVFLHANTAVALVTMGG